MQKSLFVRSLKGLVLSAAVVGLAHADTTYDTTAVVTAIGTTVAAIGAIGAAIVAGPKLAVRAWRWIAGAL